MIHNGKKVMDQLLLFYDNQCYQPNPHQLHQKKTSAILWFCFIDRHEIMLVCRGQLWRVWRDCKWTPISAFPTENSAKVHPPPRWRDPRGPEPTAVWPWLHRPGWVWGRRRWKQRPLMFGLTPVRLSVAAAAGGRCRSDPNPPSPCRLRSKNLCWRDKQEGRQTLGGRTRGPGSPGGRWPLRCDGFSTARRVLVSSTPSPHVHAAELPLARPSIRAGHLPGSARSFVPFPGARTHPSWESMWDVYRRSGQRSAFEHPGHPHRLAAAPQGHKLDFYPFCGPPPHFPRMMETGYLRRGEAPNCSTHQPPPPRFLAAAYLGHWKEL